MKIFNRKTPNRDAYSNVIIGHTFDKGYNNGQALLERDENMNVVRCHISLGNSPTLPDDYYAANILSAESLHVVMYRIGLFDESSEFDKTLLHTSDNHDLSSAGIVDWRLSQ